MGRRQVEGFWREDFDVILRLGWSAKLFRSYTSQSFYRRCHGQRNLKYKQTESGSHALPKARDVDHSVALGQGHERSI